MPSLQRWSLLSSSEGRNQWFWWLLGFTQGLLVASFARAAIDRWMYSKSSRGFTRKALEAQKFELSERVQRQPENPFLVMMPLMKDPEKNVVLCQGVPPPSLFPLAQIAIKTSDSAATIQLTTDETTQAQRYPPLCWSPLKEWITNHMKELHSPVSPNWSVAIAAGSMSSVDLSIAMFLNPGDTLLIEEFSFTAAIDAFTGSGLHMEPVSTDTEGLDPASLERALRRSPQARALYIIPVGQNPLGTRLAPSRYQRIYDICLAHGVWIIEDDPYFYQQHNAGVEGVSDNQAVPGLQGLGPSFLSVDKSGIVLRLDSFSKVLAPGFRIGWVTGSKRLVEAYDKLAYASSQNGCSISIVMLQKILQRWETTGFESQVRQLQVALRRRCRALLWACKRHLDDCADWDVPFSGMFLWLRLPLWPGTSGTGHGPSDRELLELMHKHCVAVIPGSACAVDRSKPVPCLRVSFVASEDSYAEGMRRLRLVLEELGLAPKRYT